MYFFLKLWNIVLNGIALQYVFFCESVGLQDVWHSVSQTSFMTFLNMLKNCSLNSLNNLNNIFLPPADEVWGKVMYFTCLWFCSQGVSTPLHAGIHPPLLGKHPPGQTLSKVDTPRQTPHPLWTLLDKVNKRNAYLLEWENIALLWTTLTSNAWLIHYSEKTYKIDQWKKSFSHYHHDHSWKIYLRTVWL